MINDVYAPEVVAVINTLDGAPPDVVDVSSWVAGQRRVARVLSAVQIRPGMRILELGTGTGFSGTALARLVGPGGSVVSVDSHPVVTDHARDAPGTCPWPWLALVTGDPAVGWLLDAPYDVIVNWRPVNRVPTAWWAQCLPLRSVLVTSVVVAHQPDRVAWIRAEVDDERQPLRPHLLPDPGTLTGPQPVRLHGNPDGYTVHLTRE